MAVAIKQFLLSINIHFSEAWLESCIDFCKSEHEALTVDQLKEKVYEQWILTDLRDLELAVLPPNLSTKQHYILTGNFCLQLMHLVDISKPKLWQLQKIRNAHVLTRGTYQDSEAAGTGKRVLQLTLSDGVQEIQAMEYRPVPCLGMNLAPGSKIRIMGPTTVRRGRLMLETHNVKLFGGKVEDLLVCNAAENVLARALNLPENPDPKPIEEKLLKPEIEEKNEGYTPINLKSSRPFKKTETAVINEEDALILAEEFDTDMEANHSNRIQHRTNLSLSLDDGHDDLFQDIDIEENKPDSAQVTIEVLKRKRYSDCVYKTKAKFKAVEEKLALGEEGFKLVIKIEDSTGDLVVKVHNDVLEEAGQCTFKEVLSLKTKIAMRDAAASSKMGQVLTKIKEWLLKIDHEMMIKMDKDAFPTLIKVL